MKKCPKCKAEIDDSARFCIFCMTSFEEKSVVSKKTGKNIILLVLTIVFALLLICSVIYIVSSGTFGQKDSDRSGMQSDFTDAYSLDTEIVESDIIITPAEVIVTDENIAESFVATDITVSTTGKADVVDIPQNHETQAALNTTAKTEGSTEPEIIQTEYEPDTDIADKTEQIPTVTEPDETTGLSQPQQTEAEITATVQTEPPKEPDATEAPAVSNIVSYTYVDATAYNAVPTGYSALYVYEGCIVITGVFGNAEDGVYYIPDKIDGKKIVAIDSFAFEGVKDYVKGVVLPSTVRVIWNNAFSGCNNLAGIYLKSKVVAIYQNAFPATESRNVSLTIYTSSDCRDFDYYYYRNISSKYGAYYSEWNG